MTTSPARIRPNFRLYIAGITLLVCGTTAVCAVGGAVATRPTVTVSSAAVR